jgi:hypothetical protein
MISKFDAFTLGDRSESRRLKFLKDSQRLSEKAERVLKGIQVKPEAEPSGFVQKVQPGSDHCFQ